MTVRPTAPSAWRTDARLADVTCRPFWADTAPPGPPCPPLGSDAACDLAIIGGGFTGLWTAIAARRRSPGARILLLEAALCGGAASGRNGGFCAPSISHGVGNALRRWPREAATLIRLGRDNLEGFLRDHETLELDAGLTRAGKINLAEKPWQVAGLRAMEANYRRFGIECSFLEGAALRAHFDSPVYPAGLFEPNYALVDPGRLVAGLRRVALAMGVEIHERTPVAGLRHDRAGGAVILETAGGRVAAGRAVLATNAAPPLLRRLAPAVIPIHDYALVTRPLATEELAAAGWTGGARWAS